MRSDFGRRPVLPVLAAVVLFGCGSPAPEPISPPPRSEVARPGRFDPVLTPVLDGEAQGWVDGTLALLDLRDAAAQLIIQWMPGAYLSPTDPAFQEPRRWVEEEGIGGIYLSIGSPHSFAALSNELQARARVPLLVASDLEDGGPGMRLNHSYALPGLQPQGGGDGLPADHGGGGDGLVGVGPGIRTGDGSGGTGRGRAPELRSGPGRQL